MGDFFRSQQNALAESQMNSAYVSPQRNGPQLPRRFTTESGRVPTLSSITTNMTIQRVPEPQDYAGQTTTQTLHKVQLLEKKRMDYERLREHKRRFEVEINKLAAQERMEELEMAQLTEDLRYPMAGHQSEPTTPPEYRETSSGFPTIFSRPNRYSTSSLTSPPGLYNRPGRSGSQLTSPLSAVNPAHAAFDEQIPSRSVPSSRRNSDEDEKEEAVRQDPTSHRSTNALNRYSMPVTRSRGYLDIGLEDSNNTTGFLFDDEDNSHDNGHSRAANDGYRSTYRPQSFISMSALSSSQLNGSGGAQSPESTTKSNPNSRPASIRHSIDMKLFQEMGVPSAPDTPSGVLSPPIMATPTKHQASFSSSELATGKTANGAGALLASANNHAQQHLHNHNASIGRIPAGAMPNRHSREMSGDASISNNREVPGFASIGSTLHANAAPFGPMSVQSPVAMSPNGSNSPPAATQYQAFSPQSAYLNTPYGGNSYPLPVMMSGMNLNGSSPSPSASYATSQSFGSPGPAYSASVGRPIQDSQARVIQSRRQMDSEAMARYANLSFDSIVGQIYHLCKDQHGCRYLQRLVESKNAEKIHAVWLETNGFVVELMADPFGNYLCQKLFEHCNDEERTGLIRNAAPHMVKVALNQHGTRALQKMIEHVTERVQIEIIVESLRHEVVPLIQDLNGNHVIQKCLNKLSSSDASFIFEAVGQHCVEVGTHRHGCCVLQRCIDHAQGAMRTWLVNQLVSHACQLVQDPFGNYVVQYIIDLGEPCFTEPLVQQFKGRVVRLSKHKFSSNVIEKCLRCSSHTSKDLLVEELLSPGEMDRLLRDSFANYVIQTALEHATQPMRNRLVEAIRPMLPQIRTTPHGRRIQAKIQLYEQARDNAITHGLGLPLDPTLGQISARPPATALTFMSNTTVLSSGAFDNIGTNGANGANGAELNRAYMPSSHLTVPPLTNDDAIRGPRMSSTTEPPPPQPSLGLHTGSTTTESPAPPSRGMHISSPNVFAPLGTGNFSTASEDTSDNSNWF